MTYPETNYRTELNPRVWQALGAAYPNIDVYDPQNDRYLDIEGNPVTVDDAKVEKYEARLRNFPLIEEQLDMLYWDQVNGTTVWKDTITKIKSDFPIS